MAACSAHSGRNSNCSGTCAGIVYVCTARLPLKVQARPVTSGCTLSAAVHGVQGAVACGTCTRFALEIREAALGARAVLQAGRALGR